MDEFLFDEATHTYTLNGIIIPNVSTILKTAGLVNLEWISQELLAEKADLGKKVHTTTELYDTDDLFLNDLHPTLQSYLQSWIKFKKDYKFESVDIEIMMFHKLFRFAGRIDRIGLISKAKTLLDIKSGTIQESHAIQTAGYELLYNQDKKLSDQIKRRMCVYLSPDGYQVREHKDKTDKNIFLAALTITNYLRRIS